METLRSRPLLSFRRLCLVFDHAIVRRTELPAPVVQGAIETVQEQVSELQELLHQRDEQMAGLESEVERLREAAGEGVGELAQPGSRGSRGGHSEADFQLAAGAAEAALDELERLKVGCLLSLDMRDWWELGGSLPLLWVVACRLRRVKGSRGL